MTVALPEVLMRTPITIHRRIGVAASGPTYDSPETTTGYVEGRHSIVATAGGQEVASTAQVWLRPPPVLDEVTVEDLVEVLGSGPRRVLTADLLTPTDAPVPAHQHLTLE